MMPCSGSSKTAIQETASLSVYTGGLCTWESPLSVLAPIVILNLFIDKRSQINGLVELVSFGSRVADPAFCVQPFSDLE
jgi:hypothetical protein